MSTLGEMKATIAAEIMRDDLADAIAKEIDRAIKFYRSKRFWFTEKQTTITLDTTSGGSVYGPYPDGLDEKITVSTAALPDIIRIDSLVMADDDYANMCSIDPIGEYQIKRLIARPSERGAPRYYSYYGGYLTLYPVPDNVYTMILTGVIRVAAPETDEEEGNAWMTEGEELIRSRAKRNIFLHWMADSDEAGKMSTAEQEALLSLQQETSARTQVSRLIASDL